MKKEYNSVGLVVAMEKEVIPFIRSLGVKETHEKINNFDLYHFDNQYTIKQKRPTLANRSFWFYLWSLRGSNPGPQH